MSEPKDATTSFSGGGATPTVTTKKVAPTGKKKVIRRLVKNAKTGEVIKTEIVRIDSNGETTITSYPAGTPVPSIGSLQASAGRKPSRTASPDRIKESSTEPSKPPVARSDIGPSVPVNVPGLDDLLRKEKEMLKIKEMAEQEKSSKSPRGKKLDESLEATLINIARRKRNKDPKSRRRGLAASTMSRRAESDDNEDKDHMNENPDSDKMQMNDDEEEVKKRKERHRRRHEKKHREKPAAYRDKEANDSGIDGPLDQRPYDPEDDEQELHPLEEAELLAKQLQASASLKQHKEAQASEPVEEAPMVISSPVDVKAQMSDISEDELDDKPKKKKKKHKSKKKKKKQKHKKRGGGSDEELSDRSDKDRRSSANEAEMKSASKVDDVDQGRKSRSKSKSKSKSQSRSRSRSSSYSSLTLSSISSEFSDSFDFAEANPMAMGDNAMFRGGFRGRGSFNMPFRGRGMFRGFPRGRPPRGGFRGGWTGFPGMFPEGMDPMGNPMFMGRGGRGMWPRGPWGPMMAGGRGGMNNVEEGGIGIYVEDESDNSRKRSRSYSSYSSYSSRSRSRSRRRHRRRHHSSSRSYSSYSRSSRSYSRSYSRSSRSYSRSYSRSSSRSYSSYSRSGSRSRSKGSKRGSSSERSDHFQDVYAQGANIDQLKQDEEVPWWAEFDKTYELQKKAEQEAKAQAKSQSSGKASEATAAEEASVIEPATKLQGTSYDFADMTEGDIDIVRTVMSLVDKTSHNQDPDVEDARRCVLELIQEVCSSQELQTAEEAVEECMNSILHQVCPDDASTDTDKNSDPNLLQFPDVANDENSKLLRWYTIACHVTKQTRSMRHQAKMLAESQEKSEDDKDSRSESEQPRSSDRRRRGRRRHRRRRHRGRSYSRSSYSSSSSEKRPSLVNLTADQQKSLQQAQQMLILQQQQLQAAGILPKSLALPLPSLIPNLLPATSTANTVPEPEVLSQRWDKDMDALLKTKSKDDITRKLLQRMKEKKQLGEAEDSSPTFLARNKSSDNLGTDKIFSGSGSLKSRKIAISSIDKSKVFDEVSGYKKSDIAAAQASIEEASSKDFERLRELEQRGKLEAWSDEQKSLKEEVKRKMREEIEKAERAKKEKLKEQMLEEEKQREIMRIREEVRQQIKQEIRDEIEKQRKQVLQDPELKSQLMELEALRQSKVSKSESGVKPSEDSFIQEQDKHMQDMNSWLEKHGKRASEMGADEMRRMQMVYMQQLHHWSQQQQKAYMQWYWHQQQHYKQHNTSMYNQPTSFYNQQSSANESNYSRPEKFPPVSSSSAAISDGENASGNAHDAEGNRGSTFTHAPSQGPRSDEVEGTTRSMPPHGLMSSHTDEQIRPSMPMQNRPPFSQPNQYNRNMQGNFSQNNEMMPRRNLPDRMMNQPRYGMQRPDMQRMRRPFQDHRDSNQGPMHQYPPAEFDHRQDEFPQRMGAPVSGIHNQHSNNRFERPQFDNRGAPRQDAQMRPQFDGHRPPAPSMDQRMSFDQRMRPPFDQQHVRGPYDQQQMRAPFNQQQMRPSFDQRPMRPRFDQHMRPEFAPRGQGPVNHQGGHIMNQGPDGQFGPRGMSQPQFVPPPTNMNRPPMQGPVQTDDVAPQKLPGTDQPPPPGVETNMNAPRPIPSLAVAPPGVDELKPPGEETSPIAPPTKEPEPQEVPSSTSKSSKKKKKKHRKHKKKRAQSSSSDDDDAQHAAILQQLEALQQVEEGEVVEVEDGEVQSDDGKKPSAIAAAAALLKQLKAKEKKRHKKKKKRRKESSSEEEEVNKKSESSAAVPEGLPPPPFFNDAIQPSLNMNSDMKQGLSLLSHPPPPHIPPVDNIPQTKPPMEESSQYPPSDFRSPPYSHLQYPSTRYNLPPNPQGAGEPHLGGTQHPMERTEQHFTHFIGPGGDHTLGQAPEQKRGRSPLPISEDPREAERWSRQMRDRYMDKPPVGGKPLSEMNVKKVEKIPSLLDKYIPVPEPRRIASLAPSMRGVRHGRPHPDDDRMGRRKPDRGGRGRGRKRKRGMPPRNYHDWDQPADDGLIYYYSDSDNSSGWGSDKNFDDLLAKKKRESAPKGDQDGMPGPFSSPQPIHVTNTRRPSPGRIPPWERSEHMGEPQGIPVIGGAKPQPIPSLANRNGPPPRNEYDHMGRPLNREGDAGSDYWMMDQQMMQRGPPQWDTSVAGGGHDPSAPWLRPGMR